MLPGQPIRLPDPAVSLTDKSVTDYVQRVLSCLGGGLALWRAGQWLCAQRLGHCHVYWAIGEELLPSCGHKPDGEVPKDREGGVFNLGPFITGEWHRAFTLLWKQEATVVKISGVRRLEIEFRPCGSARA